MEICCECAASMFSTEIVNPARCQGCGREHPVTMDSVRGESKENRQLRALVALGVLEAMPVQLDSASAYHVPGDGQPVARPYVEPDANVCRVVAMRAAFKAAKAAGLDTANAEAMRAAIAKYFRRPCSSRRDLSSGQWIEFTVGIELGVVGW